MSIKMLDTGITPAERADYDALARLWNTVYPDDCYTGDAFYHLDSVHEAPCRCARFVVKRGSDVVASSSYMQYVGMYHPQKVMVNVFVHPEHRSAGLGGRLYDDLMAHLRPFDPISLNAQVRETETQALGFADRRGFRETKRDWQAVLEPSRFDPAPYRGLEAKLAGEGLRLARLAELERSSDRADLEARFHRLWSELRQDVPRSEPATPITFEQFQKLFLNAPDFYREGVFFALCGDDLVGMTMFWQGEGDDALHTGLTGVRRAYRGRGVATALKVRALEFARTLGASKVYTDNDTGNEEMIAVNAKLGFERQPAWIGLRRVMGEAA